MGTQIPKLCATDMVDAFGSCRLCLVEIEGRAGTPASCTTPVAPGMVVKTQTDRLKRLRKGVMELYISDHPLDCLTCSANGDCELQDMAGAVGLRDVRYGYDGENHVFAKNDGAANPNWLPKDESNPYFTYDPSKCIVCSRCVRACEEVQGTFALTIAGRGFDSRVSPGMEESFLGSECVSCGACVQACPTATLNEKSVIRDRHARTFGRDDLRLLRRRLLLQGRDARRRAGAHGALQGRQGEPRPFLREGPLRLGLCDPQGAHPQADDPRQGHRSVEGSELGRGDRLRRLRVQAHPGQVRQGFGRRHHVVALHQRRDLPGAEADPRRLRQQQRRYLRARLPLADRLWPVDQTYGTSAGTQDFDSVEETDVIIVIGANPTDGASGVRVAHEEASASGRQADRDRSAPHRNGALGAYRSGVSSCRCCPAPMSRSSPRSRMSSSPKGLFDEKFVRERCDWDEFQDWAEFVSLPQNSPEEVAKISGVPAQTIRDAARLYATGGNGAIYYGLGVTEHSQGSTTVMAIANLAMATGNIGRPGVGVNPLRGQNNVQGACDMGSFPHELSGYRHISTDCDARIVRERCGVSSSTRSRACASRTCSTPRSTARSRASTSRARTFFSPIPTPSTSRPVSRRWNAWSCRICS